MNAEFRLKKLCFFSLISFFSLLTPLFIPLSFPSSLKIHSALCILHSALSSGHSKLNNNRSVRASKLSRASKSYLFVFVSLLTIQHPASFARCHFLHRKEVIQPHLPIRLPCYDLTPIIDPTFDGCLLAVGPPALGVTHFHGLTGGVYKARERIHRGMLIRDY